MAINKLNLEHDGLVVGDTQLVASGGGVSVGQNLVVQGNNYVENSQTIGGILTVGGNITTSGNLSLTVGNLSVSAGSGKFNGIYIENTDDRGVFIGNAGSGTPSPRIGFFNGNPTQNWQIDNYFGSFRWFTPGVVRLSLDPTGNLSIPSSNPSAVANDTTVPTSAWVRSYGGSQSANVYTGTNFTFSNTAGFVPPGVSKIKVTVVGGGGAGGGNPATVGSAGGGGGGGGQSIVYLTNVAGLQFWANVGAGGVSVTNATGGTGNISVFTLAGTIYASASGGGGGAVGIAGSSVGGNGGTGASGNINLTGTAGQGGSYAPTAGNGFSGGGAPGYQGTGGAPVVRTAATGSAAGVAGTSGGGGSGSNGGAATATTNIGGRGGNGLIIVEW